MKPFLPLLLLLSMSMAGLSQNVSLTEATRAARLKMTRFQPDPSYRIAGTECVTGTHGETLFYLFDLEPAGYVVVSGRCELPPVIAYSFTSNAGPGNLLKELVSADLTLRLQHTPPAALERNRQQWEKLSVRLEPDTVFQQWPEPGTTSTEGWLETNWTQSYPYNILCPMDPVTSQRSVAGCPATAMAQVVNFHETTNGVEFDDGDDYYHSYAGRNYWIDDDYASIDFPSFPDLQAFLDTLDMNYFSGKPLEDRDMAALTFACGVAATQVYTSSVSGTFGVDQAFAAYQKFNFDECELLMGTDTTIYDLMSQNIKDTLPVHLAVVDPGWTMGHNVVVDGYNTDEYFHLNFGWGGAYNGWYLLPEEIPYGLTVIEGAVLDIIPDDITGTEERKSASVLTYPNPAESMVMFMTAQPCSGPVTITVTNIQGKVMMQETGSGDRIHADVSGLPAGLYSILVKSEEFCAQGKLIRK